MDRFKEYRINPSVISTELDLGAVLLNLETKYYYNLNETGFRIWNLVKKSCSLSQILMTLTNEYEIDLQRASASLTRIIKKLEQEDLIIPIK
jgi:hypothetical protein